MGLERLSPNHAAARPAERRAARGVVVRSFSPRVESTGTTHAQSFVLFSSRRRHTRCSRDWRFRRVLFRSNATVEDAVRAEHQRLAMNHVSMSNSITRLRLCSTLDWNEHVEGASLIEQIPRRDPPGVSPRMAFASRDRYRHAVEALAEPSGEAQVRVALRAIESARQAAETPGLDPRRAHVGYHLIGGGRRELAIDVASRPRLGARFEQALFAHATPCYLGALALRSEERRVGKE